MIQTAQRMENLPFSGIRVMMERANQMQKLGEDVIHMEIGRHDFDRKHCAVSGQHQDTGRFCKGNDS